MIADYNNVSTGHSPQASLSVARCLVNELRCLLAMGYTVNLRTAHALVSNAYET